MTGLRLAAGSGAEKYVMKYEICNFGAFLTPPPLPKKESLILGDRSKKGFGLAEPGGFSGAASPNPKEQNFRPNFLSLDGFQNLF